MLLSRAAGLEARQPRDFKHIALGQLLVADQGEGGRLHANEGRGAGDAVRLGLVADIDHAGRAGLVEVREGGHGFTV